LGPGPPPLFPRTGASSEPTPVKGVQLEGRNEDYVDGKQEFSGEAFSLGEKALAGGNYGKHVFSRLWHAGTRALARQS